MPSESSDIIKPNKNDIFLKYIKREEGKWQTREQAISQWKDTLEFYISALKYKIGELHKELDFMISMRPQ
jgi:hypothetical protein